MTYSEWENMVPSEIQNDAVWRVKAYRWTLFLGDLAWNDCKKLLKERRTLSVADQLYRSSGSISSQITEGYSRSGGNDRARFYEYALGSARESRDWYYKSSQVLGATVSSHRIALTTEILCLLITMIFQQRPEPKRRPR